MCYTLFKTLTNAAEAWIDVNPMHRVQIQKDRITVLVILDIAETDSTVQVQYIFNSELYLYSSNVYEM